VDGLAVRDEDELEWEFEEGATVHRLGF